MICAWCARLRFVCVVRIRARTFVCIEYDTSRHVTRCSEMTASDAYKELLLEGEDGGREKQTGGGRGVAESKRSETEYHAIDNGILYECEEQMRVRPDTVGGWVRWGIEVDGNSILWSLRLPQP